MMMMIPVVGSSYRLQGGEATDTVSHASGQQPQENIIIITIIIIILSDLVIIIEGCKWSLTPTNFNSITITITAINIMYNLIAASGH